MGSDPFFQLQRVVKGRSGKVAALESNYILYNARVIKFAEDGASASPAPHYLGSHLLCRSALV